MTTNRSSRKTKFRQVCRNVRVVRSSRRPVWGRALLCLMAIVWVCSSGEAQSWTFTPLSTPGMSWNSIAWSADGNTMIGAGTNGIVYLSMNSGTNWNATAVGAEGPVVCSADARTFLAQNGSDLYVSTNFGSTWTTNTTPQAFTIIASSADCTRLIAQTNNLGGATETATSSPYLSTNTGQSWEISTLQMRGACGGIASSADGATLLAQSDLSYLEHFLFR